MATEYQLSYTAQEIDERLGKVPTLETELGNVKSSANEEISNIKESLSNALVLNESGVFDTGGKELLVGALEIDPVLDTVGIILNAEVPEPSEGEGRPTGALSFYDSSYDRAVILRNVADGEGDNDAATVRQLNNAVGYIESALDSIIEIQNSLIGGGRE